MGCSPRGIGELRVILMCGLWLIFSWEMISFPFTGWVGGHMKLAEVVLVFIWKAFKPDFCPCMFVVD